MKRANLNERLQVLSKLELFLICVVIILTFTVICLLIDLNQASNLSQFLLDGYRDASAQGLNGSMPYFDSNSMFPGFTLM